MLSATPTNKKQGKKGKKIFFTNDKTIFTSSFLQSL